MTTQDISLFKALGAKMNYLGQRQRLISQNIANSDTPNYQPQDLKAVDFKAVLGNIKGVNGGGVKPVSLQATNSGHVGVQNGIDAPKEYTNKHTYEIAPVGNAVIVEEQMLNAGEVMMDYTLMTNLYQKNVNMLRTAIRGSR